MARPPVDLPITAYLEEISSRLEAHRVLLLSAEPGAGKSTCVPPFLVDAGWLAGKRIVMLEPRRLAAASIASRIAELLGEPVGRRAGYRVRSARHVSRETRIEIVTEALLTRMIQADPLLEGTGLVIFDEFHERSIHADLGLALVLEVRRARPDLGLLVMSATPDVEKIRETLDGAPVLSCPGRAFPVETRYHPPGGRARWEEETAEGVARLFDSTEGDILVFLPGMREIGRVGERLGMLLGGRADIRVLHGSLSLEAQRGVIRPDGDAAGGAGSGRRLILSTSIAETSLTVPGIRVIADSGWARLSRFHPATGLDRLMTERVSAASADQRRGRAGRLGPGLCVRFWKESEPLLPHTEPEILRCDLAGLALECALWGAREPGELRWLDPPPSSSWRQAMEILGMLGLVGKDGRVSKRGREVAALGLHPRLGVLVLEGAGRGEAGLAAACAAVLSERDGSQIGADPDLRLRLEMLRGKKGGSTSWRGLVNREMERILRRTGGGVKDRSWTGEREERLGEMLARAFPDRIARREPDGSYRFVTGRVARLPARDAVEVPSRAAGEWIVAAEADAGVSVGTVRLAAPIGRSEAEKTIEPFTVETVEVRWDGLVPKGFSVRSAGRLILGERSVRIRAEDLTSSLYALVRSSGTGVLPWDDRCRSLLERMRFYAAHGQGSGDESLARGLSDGRLSENSCEWLGPYAETGGGPAVTRVGLFAALRGLMGGREADFRKKVPEACTLPTGHGRSIDYSSGIPTVEARIQEVFGLSASPRVCGVPIVFKLLSPARRPLQITDDLSSFWEKGYAQVRKEMRGRYPKHYWPENPRLAVPTSGVRPAPKMHTAPPKRTGSSRKAGA